jgi:hypothetical protein
MDREGTARPTGYRQHAWDDVAFLSGSNVCTARIRFRCRRCGLERRHVGQAKTNREVTGRTIHIYFEGKKRVEYRECQQQAETY